MPSSARPRTDVVFFGGSARPDRTARAAELTDRAQGILVAGSTLSVFGVRRLVNRMARGGRPIAIINRGATRGDHLAAVTLSASTTRALTALLRALRADRNGSAD
jgi:NAD-dependent SIR2 family protein deacetylase